MLKNNDFKSFIIGFLLAMVMMLVMGSAPQLSHADTITVKLQHSGTIRHYGID
jgi:hypothetical protein